MQVNDTLDTGIKFAILIFIILIIFIIIVTWWNWFNNPAGFLPDPTNPSTDDLGGWIKDMNDMIKKFLGG